MPRITDELNRKNAFSRRMTHKRKFVEKAESSGMSPEQMKVCEKAISDARRYVVTGNEQPNSLFKGQIALKMTLSKRYPELLAFEGKIGATLQQVESLTVEKKDRDETLSLLIVYFT